MKRYLPLGGVSLFFLCFGLLGLTPVHLGAQVQLSNGSPSITLDFSASMPATVATNPGSPFAGAGFEPTPSTAGRLNSNAWAATGMSDGALAFGGTRLTGDYARGSTAAAVSTGGFYAYTGAPHSAANPCLMIQPGGSDWAPGTLTLRIQNTGTTAITALDVAYNLYIRNDQDRANSFNFSYSTDSTNYLAVPALNYTSPEALDANGWVLVDSAPSRSTTLTGLNIAPGGAIFIRWSGADVSGTNSRDEFGLDDIELTATFASALPVLNLGALDAVKPEGDVGFTPFIFRITRSGDVSDASSVNYAVTGSGGDPADANDFNGTFPNGSVNFAIGDTLADITINVSGDLDVEADEGFTVTISDPVNATIGIGQASGTIENDDNSCNPDNDPPMITCPDDVTIECDAPTDPPLQPLLVLQYDPVGPQVSVNPLPPAFQLPGFTASSLSQTGFGGWGNNGVWPVGLIGGSPVVPTGQYLSFTLTTTATVQPDYLQYDKFSYNGGGASLATIRSSLDGFAADIQTIPVGPIGFENLIFDLSGMSPISGTVEFRIYFYASPVPDTDWSELVSSQNGANGLRFYIQYFADPPVVTDNCDSFPTITYTDLVDLDGCGGYTGTITRTWQAEDAAGNVETCEQLLTIVDTTPPVWDQNPLPQDLTVECDAIPDPAELTASDNCTMGGGGGMNVLFINELHYDNTGADVNEFVEVAGTAGLDLAGYTIVWYNGSGGASYGTTNLSGVIPDEGMGTGALAFTFVGIQNGAPDGLALVDPANNVLQFLSYEGAFTATNGPANGMLSEDIGVLEVGNEPVGLSLQLIGTGSDYADFTWTGPAAESPGALNDGQEFGANPSGPGVTIELVQTETPGDCTDEYTLTRTWTATDACDNAITHTQVITVQDNTPPVWDQNMPGNITVECDQVPAPFSPVTASDNCDDEVDIVLLELIVEGDCPHNYTLTRTWTATDNCDNAITHTQVITVQDTTPPVWDQDPLPQDLTVECDAIPNPAELTASDNCTMGGGGGMNVLFINELHYDNTGADVNEFVEVAGTAGLDLTGYSIVWYNGSGGASYGTTNLSGVIPDEGMGTGALAFTFVGIQNGAPDGLALVDPANNVLQFLSYEGVFTATNGPANGMMSVDIGVLEVGNEPVGLSLQLIGSGSDYADFTWTGPAAESPGALNDGQEFLGGPGGPGVEVTFTQMETPGDCTDEYTLTRTWTATDACDNAITHTQVITVQDNTPPVWDQNMPGNITVECDQVPAPLSPVTASDNCDDEVEVVLTEVRTDGNCPHNYTLTRTWTATDNCDNAITHTQVITVQDTTPPVWETDPLPQNVTVACNMVPPVEVLEASDNCSGDGPQEVVFINEIHYDNAGTDQGEFIEVAGTAGLNLAGYSLVLYNGSNPANALVYNTLNLSGVIPDEGNGTGALAFFYPSNGIQNGPNDGVALVQGTTVLELLSYEGSFTAGDGPAAGMMAVDMGVLEVGNEPVGLSLQRVGSGSTPGAFTWTGPVAESPGSLNANQNFTLPTGAPITYGFTEQFTPGACLGEGTITRTWTATDACANTVTHTQTITLVDDLPPMFNPMVEDITVECDAVPAPPTVEAVDGCGPVAGIQPWINELHYDNIGTDQNEFFEIAGPAGIDLSGYTVYLYNGANGLLYDTRPLSGILPNEGKGYGALAFVLPENGIQNGAPDGLALVQGANTVVQFLSYEGAFVAVDGPAAGQASVNIGVAQEPVPPLGQSLQLTGTGNQYGAFTWTGPAPWSPGTLNAQQLAGPVDLAVLFTEQIIPGSCTGQYTIVRTWTATDDCGNQGVMTQTVTVEDTTPPVALCRDVTLYLDDNGEATLDPADVDNGSTDNCSPVTFELSQSLFTCAEVGENTVTLTVRDDCGNAASCTAIATVLDTIAPVIACPPSRIINLDPGLCCAIVSWAEPTVTDNCPFTGPSGQLNTINNANNFNASGGAVHFDIVNTTGGPLTITELGMRLSAGSIVNIYTRSGTYAGFQTNAAAWTLTATADATTGPFSGPGFGNGTLTPAPIAGGWVIPPGVTGVTLHTPTAAQQYTNGTGGNQFFTDGTIEISLGSAQNTLWGAPFTPRVWNGYVKYETVVQTVPPTQISGPTSGEELCKDDSPWTVTYEAFDASGNRGECSFTIEVYEFPNPVSNLNCNDLVQVSLDEDCDTRIGADMILEGGPYGCYDDYEVTVFNQQNIPLPTSPFVGRAQIGGLWKVQVTDPVTGNSCWGMISVEDKQPPVLVCRDIAVDCGEEIPETPAPALTGPQSIIRTGLNEPIGEPGAPVPDVHVYEFDYSYLPAGTPVQDVDVRVRLTGHTWLPDLNIEVISPSGTVADVFTLTGCFGQEWPIDVIFDDQGQGGLTQCAQLNAGGARLQPVLAPGQSGTALFVFNGEDASGIWRIRFTDNVGLDDGVIEIAGLILTAEAPGIPVTDNCTPVSLMNTIGPRLNYGEDIENFTCAQNAEISRRITRVWTARDEWENSTQCVQRIDVRRPTLTSLVLPPNYDDLDEAALDCRDGYPGPEVTGFPAGGGCGSLQMGYTDKVLEVCQGSYTIIRSWTLHDMCTGGVGQHDQVIKVIDKTPPVLFCPAEHDIKLGKTTQQGKDCTANVMMPWIQVTDDCSTTNNLTFYVWTTLPDGSVVIVNTMNAQGFFVFDLPVQPAPHQYTFTYSAIDDCGNKAECTVNVPVRDQTPPVVICETFHTVALTDSITFVNAESFDDGSYDDCSMLSFTVRRGSMNAAGAFIQHPCNQPGDFLYGPQVRFYCCDIDHPTQVFVDVRVRDAYGNDNFCMVPVEVVDKIRPTIWCPDDITVQCGMPYEPTGVDTFTTCINPGVTISNAFAQVYPLTLDIFGIPADARITDLDLKLNITHELVNQLRISLYSPLGRKAEVLTADACAGQPVQFPTNINVTFNDQAYDINVFNQTGQRQPATFRCTNAQPSIGSYNQGQMKPQGDELKVFNGQPLNSFTDKDLCFTVSASDITLATKRMSNFQVQSFIAQAGLIAGDRILLEYASFTGSVLDDLSQGQVYLFQVINANTIEFLAVTGTDLVSVPAGSTHMFCASGTWLLVVEDLAPLAGGKINEVCMHIGYELPTGYKPHVMDNTEECGLNVTHQDLGQPDQCADNTFINRRWTVADNFGNNTSCIQRVYFEDETPLTVQFPCDVTVNCPTSPDNTGEVRHNGDCELVGVEFTDHVLTTTDACYKILRTWVVKDWCTYQPDGNVDYPTTNIDEQLEQVTFTTAINALFTSRRINLGDRFTLRYVTSGSAEIPGLIEGDVYSVVRVSGTTVRFEYNTTKQQPVNITGQGTGPHVFRYANSEQGLPITCYVLLEWYPFVDWYTGCCNPLSERRAWEDDGDGYFTFVQEIKVIDQVAPEWVDCSDLEFCSFEEDCEPTFVELIGEATDQCTPQEQLSYFWSIDFHNDGTTDLEGVTADASGAYPNGTHRIVFKVTDQCGNWNTCTKLFTIRDCKKPTPVCINGLVVELMPSTGFADVPATSFESGDSYDNCTEYENLIIKVERLSQVSPGQNAPDGDAGDVVTVSCLDMPPNTQTPILEVVIWVGDEAGNWDYCITTLWVQDWMGPCAATMNSELVTHVVNEELEGVEQVEVHLTGNQGQWPLQLTSGGGTASFGQVPVQGQYTVTPHKDIQPLNGVSTYDLLLMQKHLLGIQVLQSPYKLIAADVNNSCNLSVSDIIELRKMILNPGLGFGNNTSWRFVEGGYVFPNPAQPCGFPEMKQYQQLQPGQTKANFTGVKIGDVSGDAVPNTLLGGEVRHIAGTLTFSIADQVLAAGQEYTLAVTAEQFRDIQGYQYTLDFDAAVLQFVGVQAQWADLSAANFGTSRAAEGLLTTSWNGSAGVTLNDGEVLYTVTFRARAATRLSQALKVNSRVTRAEAYDAADELLDVQFRFDGDLVIGGEFELYQNEPNPFRDITIIGFHLPERSTATLKVFDVTGKMVKVVTGEFAKGYNTINLTRAEIPGQGALMYRLDTPTHSATRRMILLD